MFVSPNNVETFKITTANYYGYALHQLLDGHWEIMLYRYTLNAILKALCKELNWESDE